MRTLTTSLSLILSLAAMLYACGAVAEDKTTETAKSGANPDCAAGKAAKGAAKKAAGGAGNRCGVAKTVRDTAGVEGTASDTTKMVK